MGERLNIHFSGKIKLEFHGARLTSDGGLLAYQELDDALRCDVALGMNYKPMESRIYSFVKLIWGIFISVQMRT